MDYRSYFNHADGDAHELYDAQEFMQIYMMLNLMKVKTLAYGSELKLWIKRADTEELSKIYFGAELPDDLAEHLDSVFSGFIAKSGIPLPPAAEAEDGSNEK